MPLAEKSRYSTGGRRAVDLEVDGMTFAHGEAKSGGGEGSGEQNSFSTHGLTSGGRDQL